MKANNFVLFSFFVKITRKEVTEKKQRKFTQWEGKHTTNIDCLVRRRRKEETISHLLSSQIALKSIVCVVGIIDCRWTVG